MNTQTEALKRALEALQSTYPPSEDQYARERVAIASLREALTDIGNPISEQPAQPQQEPVAGMDEMVNRFLAWPLPESVCTDPCTSWPGYSHSRIGTSLLTAIEARQMLEYVLQDTSPPASKPLTDGQIEREWQFLHDEEGNPPDQHEFARAIEAAHGITGETE